MRRWVYNTIVVCIVLVGSSTLTATGEGEEVLFSDDSYKDLLLSTKNIIVCYGVRQRYCVNKISP